LHVNGCVCGWQKKMNETREYMFKLEIENQKLKSEILELRQELSLMVDLNLDLRKKLIDATRVFNRVAS